MANDRARFLAAVGMRPPRRAPCTFVRLNEVVLPSPVPPGQLSHGRPLPDGLSGELEVTWTVETPLLIGGRSNDEPVTLGDGGPWILPGASLRGMIRAVLEIAAFARLAFVGDGRFGLRDYEHKTWKAKIPLRGPQDKAPGGWLERGEDGRLRLIEATPVEIRIQAISRALGLSTAHDCIEWHCLSLHDRRRLLAKKGLAGEIDLGQVGGPPGQKGWLLVAGAVKSEVERRNTGNGRFKSRLRCR